MRDPVGGYPTAELMDIRANRSSSESRKKSAAAASVEDLPTHSSRRRPRYSRRASRSVNPGVDPFSIAARAAVTAEATPSSPASASHSSSSGVSAWRPFSATRTSYPRPVTVLPSEVVVRTRSRPTRGDGDLTVRRPLPGHWVPGARCTRMPHNRRSLVQIHPCHRQSGALLLCVAEVGRSGRLILAGIWGPSIPLESQIDRGEGVDRPRPNVDHRARASPA